MTDDRQAPSPAGPSSTTLLERPPTSNLRRALSRGNLGRWFVRNTALVAVVVLVAPPIGALLYGSLRTAPPGEPSPFVLDNYVAVFTDTRFSSALTNTLIVSASVSIVCMVLGTFFAWVIHRTNVPLKRTLTLLITMSFFFPSFISAMAWAILASPRAGIFNQLLGDSGFRLNVYSLAGIIWVMVLSYLPYAFLFTSGPIQSIDPSLEESARMAGASEPKIFLTITLPLVQYSVLSSGLLIFVHSLGVFGVPAVLGTPAGIWTLATRMWGLTQFYPSNYPLAAAIGLVLVAFAVIAMAVNRWYLGRRRYTSITARGYRPGLVDIGRWRHLCFAVVVVYATLAVLVPAVTIFVRSLVPYISPGEPLTISFDAYREALFGLPAAPRAFRNSLWLSAGGGLAALLLCTVVAYFIVKDRYRARRLLDALSTIPIAVPGLVIGMGLLWFYLRSPFPVYGTMWILLLSYVARYLPYGVNTISSSLVQLDDALPEASYVSGAGWVSMMRTIVVPLIRPALFGAYLIFFVDFFKELSSAVLLYRHGNEVLSVMIWDLFANGHWAVASALALISLVIVYAILIVVYVARPQAISPHASG